MFCYVTVISVMNILYSQGNSLLNSGKLRDAIDVYSKGIKLDCSNHILYANRAMAYIKIKE